MSVRKLPFDEPTGFACPPPNLPDNVREIVRIFRAEGSYVYLVGGCVRDLLLGREPHDYDLALSVGVDDVVSICRRHGIEYQRPYAFISHVVAWSGGSIDLDTIAGGSLKEDLAARDITINSLAYDMDAQTIIDYMGGIEDLEEGLVRFNNRDSLGENPHNMLRALRFSLELGFRIEKASFEAMQANVSSFSSISPDVLVRYMEKLLRGGRDFFV